MIGLSLSKKYTANAPDTDVGMLDVSANALAVLILATMMVITVAAPPVSRGEVRSSDRPELFYPSPLETVVSPQSAYWIVSEVGLTPLDLSGFATQLVDGATVARTAQGEATLIIDRTVYRDLNDHRLQIRLDWAEMRATAAPIAVQEDLFEVHDEIRSAFENDGVAPTFFVTPEGTNVFSDLYWELRKAQVPMRWVPFTPETNLGLSRRFQNFETRARQWQ